MFISFSIKDILFCNHKNAALIKENRAILLKNISKKYLGWSKSEIITFNPGVQLFEFKKNLLVDLLIQTGKKLANELPGISILPPSLDDINFYTLHINSESFVKYFKKLTRFISFAKEAFRKITGVQPSLAIGKNPFLNSIILCLTDDELIEINQANLHTMLHSIHTSNCFFFTEQDKNRLFHLRIHSLNELIRLFTSSNFERVLSTKAQSFLKNLAQPCSQTLYRLEPRAIASAGFMQELYDENQFSAQLLDLIETLKNILDERDETATKALLFIKNSDDCVSQIISLPQMTKEVKAILPLISQTVRKTLKPPITEVNIMALDVSPKSYIQRSFFDKKPTNSLNIDSHLAHSQNFSLTRSNSSKHLFKYSGLKKVYPTSSIIPEKSYTYKDLLQEALADPNSNDLKCKKNTCPSINPTLDVYPPIIFSRPISVICIRVSDNQIKYIIIGNKKIKIAHSYRHLSINPEWWNCSFLSSEMDNSQNINSPDLVEAALPNSNSKQIISSERKYYKVLTRSGILLWLVEIDSRFYLQGVWS